MIVRRLSGASGKSALRRAGSASDVFLETQKNVRAPYAIIFQAVHSKLAGDLASALHRDTFGPIPTEIIHAIAEHDYGWQESDGLQIDSLGTQEPQPFPCLRTEETLPSWNKSVAHARHLGPLAYVMVSRHFALLGGSDPGRCDFVRTENRKRAEVEQELPHTSGDLDRWTAAMGFCDLLSLYLCSGSCDPVEFPVAHPAHSGASTARKVEMSWEGDLPRFSEPVLQRGAKVSLEATRYEGAGTELCPVALEWRFPWG